MVNITSENRHAYENGWLCPKCGGQVITCRHIGSRKWRSDCDYTLQEEGDTSPYKYYEHLSVGTPPPFISKEALQKKAEIFIDNYLDMGCFRDPASLRPAFLEGFVYGWREAEKYVTKEQQHDNQYK